MGILIEFSNFEIDIHNNIQRRCLLPTANFVYIDINVFGQDIDFKHSLLHLDGVVDSVEPVEGDADEAVDAGRAEGDVSGDEHAAQRHAPHPAAVLLQALQTLICSFTPSPSPIFT